MPKRKFDQTPLHVIKAGIVYELRPEPEGGYTINIPSLPGCLTFGETIEEAMTMIADAMEGWLYVSAEKGLYIPEEFERLVPKTARRPRRKAS